MKPLELLAVGDLILDEPGPIEPYFADSLPVLQGADILVGHVETPHTDRNLPSCVDIQAPPSKPEHLKALVEPGFTVCSVAGNHLYDCGPYGVIDTVNGLKQLGIHSVGGGANIDEAKAPAIVERGGVSVGFLSYNATGPKLGWAMSQKAGCNYVDVATYYHQKMDMPGSPPRIHTFVWQENLEQLQQEVAALKQQVDIVVVSLHKGNGGITAALDTYERPLCFAAIDAGADVILGHHHHLLKGVELYKGKPIFHGLGNFVTITYAMTAGHNDTPEMVRYLKQRAAEGRGDGHYPTPHYPWAPVSLNTMIAKVSFTKEGVCAAGFVPCLIDATAVPRVKNRADGGEAVLDFVRKQTDGARLGTQFEWSQDGSWVQLR